MKGLSHDQGDAILDVIDAREIAYELYHQKAHSDEDEFDELQKLFADAMERVTRAVVEAANLEVDIDVLEGVLNTNRPESLNFNIDLKVAE